MNYDVIESRIENRYEKIKKQRNIVRFRVFMIVFDTLLICASVYIVCKLMILPDAGKTDVSVDTSAISSDAYDVTSENVSNAEESDWELTLVNKWNTIDEELVNDIELKRLNNGQSVDIRCYPYLQELMDDCREEGYKPIIISSFRTSEKQQRLFEQQVRICMNEGMSRKAAEAEASRSVAAPGTSEHQIGLAVDITDVNNQKVVSGMETQPVQQWLMKNSWRYGFILRYPPDKSDITGVVYEPWHYRYVGYEAAKYIYENEITLEEYIEILE